MRCLLGKEGTHYLVEKRETEMRLVPLLLFLVAGASTTCQRDLRGNTLGGSLGRLTREEIISFQSCQRLLLNMVI